MHESCFLRIMAFENLIYFIFRNIPYFYGFSCVIAYNLGVMNTISQFHNSVLAGNSSNTLAVGPESGLTAENPKFQELLQIMMFSSQLSESQGSSGSGQGSIFNSNLFMPLMIG